MKYLLGYDMGSSFVKAALLDADTGIAVASVFSPDRELNIDARQPGWAEQDPEQWWSELVQATRKLHARINFDGHEVIAIGISYQMHGLVCVDKLGKPVRPAIIWCDSRAVETGRVAQHALGTEFCLTHYLNAPGNFTASKLAWVKDNEPTVFNNIYKVMLPGDYIAMRLTGEIRTTISGLSEGIFWDFLSDGIASDLLRFLNVKEELLPEISPTFSIQGNITEAAGFILGLKKGIPVAYRAGDQPNNAYALNVLEPGEIAAAAGTSGVIYGVMDHAAYDPLSRVNTFVHVTDRPGQPRLGMLMCVNGCGILYSWLRRYTGGLDYHQMNQLASSVAPGSEGLGCMPFGNGAERILENKSPGASLTGLDLNRHGISHVLRAAQEGIGFALRYGLDILKSTGMTSSIIRAGHANLFLSPIFREIFVNVTGVALELFDTDGAIGAARGAGVGAGFYPSPEASFIGMRRIAVQEPSSGLMSIYESLYGSWKNSLRDKMEND